MKRTGKFYRKNEAEVMKSLGLEPTPNSGSGWIAKEDGSNDYIICQLKSTDAQSIRVQQNDIHILEQHAQESHKLPLFAIQFLNTGEVWLMAKPEDLPEIAEYINTGKTINKATSWISEYFEELDREVMKAYKNRNREEIPQCPKKIKVDDNLTPVIRTRESVKSSLEAREQFKKDQEEKYKKVKSAK